MLDRADSPPEGSGRAESPIPPGDLVNAPGAPEDEGVQTLVCIKCGTEYYFAEGSAPSDLVCEKCGNAVFRTFFSHELPDQADEDFRESTERNLDPDDAEGDTLPGDVLDLDFGQ